MPVSYTAATEELMVATLAEQGTKAWDQVYVSVPTFEKLRQSGSDKPWDGSGTVIKVPITIAKNPSVGKTSGFKTVKTAPSDTLKEAYYQLRRYYATVTYDQDQKDINRGSKQLIDLVAYKIDEGKKSIIEDISADLYASSTATDALDSLVVGIDSTGTIGGVNQSTYSAWAAYEAAVGSWNAGGIEAMQTAFNTISKGKNTGKPDFVVTTQTVFQYLQSTMRAYWGGSDWYSQKGDLGVEQIKFMGADVIFDTNCASATMFLMNTKSMQLVLDQQANFKMTDFVKPVDQMAYAAQMYCRLQVIIKERRAQGKLTGITA